MTEITLRYATAEDSPEIWEMLQKFATSMKAEAEFTVSMNKLRDGLFRLAPEMRVLVAARTHEICGVATFCTMYSTWRGRRGIHLEDLYVLPNCRRAGVGSLLVSGLAHIATECGYTHIRWSVRSWNTHAVDFYSSLGARHARHIDVYDLSGAAMVEAASDVQSIE
ncbi:N-acetyltransferase family protein [Nocardia brasiliensis]